MNSVLDEFDAVELRRRLFAWHRRHARSLPWKEHPEAYRIWISEIMLQQTTVAAVIPYYERFLRRFPDVRALADADEAEVLKLWEGLGYYSRARNLHRAARVIMTEHAGRFPQSPAELQTLPGIGRYTAGAIASFAFDARAPIVEANTLRLYCRLLGYSGDPRSSAGQDVLWRFAESLLPARGSGRVNQALMDLGAILCTPIDPRCDECPLSGLCRARAEGSQASIPAPKPRPAVTALQDIAVAIRDRGRVLVRQRQAKERWAGLWDFPRWTSEIPIPAIKTESPPSPGLSRRIVDEIAARTGLEVVVGPLAKIVRHAVTRYRIELFCFLAEKVGGRLRKDEPLRWIALGELNDLPLSMTGRKFAKELQTPRR